MSKTIITAELGIQQIIVTREFDFPRELVFEALTDPEAIPHWWGPRGLTTKVDKMEVRPGGLWRFVQQDADGNEFAFRGVYHSITQDEGTVATFEWEGMPGHVIMETMTLEDNSGKTKMTSNMVFQSVADRDGMLQSGMEEGTTDSSDRLEECMAKMQKANVS